MSLGLNISQNVGYTRILNMSLVLNMPGSEYARVLNMSRLHRVQNMGG